MGAKAELFWSVKINFINYNYPELFTGFTDLITQLFSHETNNIKWFSQLGSNKKLPGTPSIVNTKID